MHVSNASPPPRGTWATYAEAARLRLKVDKTGMADLLGIERSTIHRWETGRTRPRDPEVIRLFAEVAGLDLDEALAAAGLRPGAESRPTPRDEEIERVLQSDLSNPIKMKIIESLMAMREEDERRHREDLQRRQQVIELMIEQARSA